MIGSTMVYTIVVLLLLAAQSAYAQCTHISVPTVTD